MEMPINLVVISLREDRAFLLKNKAFGETLWRGNKSLIHKSPVGKITPPPGLEINFFVREPAGD